MYRVEVSNRQNKFLVNLTVINNKDTKIIVFANYFDFFNVGKVNKML